LVHIIGYRIIYVTGVVCTDSECCIGTMDLKDVECSDTFHSHMSDHESSSTGNKQSDNDWRRCADINLNMVDTSPSIYHGIVFWTVLNIVDPGTPDPAPPGRNPLDPTPLNPEPVRSFMSSHSSKSCNISSHPNDHPESLQAVRCFQSPLKCDQNQSSKVFIKYSQGSFTVGVINIAEG
jgi:hypothetical protein